MQPFAVEHSARLLAKPCQVAAIEPYPCKLMIVFLHFLCHRDGVGNTILKGVICIYKEY